MYCFDVTGSPSNADLDGKIQHLSEMIDQKVESIERAIIEEFITSGMAPNFEEFPSDFPNFVKRKIEGESYSKLAYELEISSGKVVDLMDQYFAKVAPFAETWWDWKQDKDAEAEPLFKQENDAPAAEDSPDENDNQDDQEDEEHGAA
ncbi:hypothetical protein G3M81_09865 [Bacillus paralicheniformis]|nr:hypothetical protein G3M81_09865 [Bacillus paralicheniformis]